MRGLKKNPLSIAAEEVLNFGSSTWARTRDLRINIKQLYKNMLVLSGLQAIIN